MRPGRPPSSGEVETQVAVSEESLRQRRFYLRLLTLWLVVSLGLTVAFGWIVIDGFKSFPREAQYWCLGVALASLLVTGGVLKWQQDAIFNTERDIRRLSTLRRASSTTLIGVEAVRERYRAEALDEVERERNKASRNRRFHRFAQAVVMLGSILVTALTGALAPASPTNWLVVVLSISVAGAAGFSNLFRWRELSFSQQQTANEIEKQYNHLELLIHDYARDDVDPEQLFAERIEALKEEQRNRELQLEHSPDKGAGEHGAPTAPPAAGT